MTNSEGLSGDISVMSVADVLAWLGNRERTGTLTITHDALVKTIRVERGHAVRLSSTSPREDLGQFLVNFGLLTPEAVEAAVLVGDNANMRLGRVLVLSSAVQESEVRRMLEHQIREAVLDTVRWDAGHFHFIPHDRVPHKAEVSVALPMLALHKLAGARAPHWSAFHLAFPRLDVRLRIDEAAVPNVPDPVRDHILALIRGGATVEAVLQQMLMMEYDLYARMYELVRAGALNPIELHMTPPSISPREIAIDISGDPPTDEVTLPRPRPISSRTPIGTVTTAQLKAEQQAALRTATAKSGPPPRITSGLVPPPVPAPPSLDQSSKAPSTALRTQAAGVDVSQDDITLRVPAWPTPPLGSVTTGYALPLLPPLGATSTASQPGTGGVVSTATPDVPRTSRTPPPAAGSPTSSDLGAAVPQLRAPLDEALRLRSSPRERYILKRIDGARTIGEIFQIVPMTDREVIEVLRGLAVAGLIQF